MGERAAMIDAPRYTLSFYRISEDRRSVEHVAVIDGIPQVYEMDREQALARAQDLLSLAMEVRE